MSARIILIIDGHPDPRGPHLGGALVDAYEEGARAARHEVIRITVADLDFPLLRSQEEFLHGAMPPALIPASAALARATHVVVFFPLWLGTMPALLKGFLEQLLRPGVAFAYTDGGTKALLKGRTGRIVATMGMPAFVFRLWFLSHGIAVLKRNILGLVGISPVKVSLLGGVEEADAARRQGWIDHMREMGRQAA